MAISYNDSSLQNYCNKKASSKNRIYSASMKKYHLGYWKLMGEKNHKQFEERC